MGDADGELLAGLSPADRSRIKQLAASLAADRASLGLWTRPLATLRHAGAAGAAGSARAALALASHPLTVGVGVPLLALYAALKATGIGEAHVVEAEAWASFATWWVGLGVLSSIGLGSGVHTGVLFLFPHVLRVALAAEACGHTVFDTRGDAWGRRAVFGCGSGAAAAAGASFRDVWLKVAPAATLWGAGTALGEIPPYALTYAAAVAGAAADGGAVLGGLSPPPGGGRPGTQSPQSGPKRSPRRPPGLRGLAEAAVAGMKRAMLELIRRYGFWGILALASWPNALFDLCGVCCGAFQVPFWTFFGATLLGKAGFKANMQTAVLLALARKGSRERLILAAERGLAVAERGAARAAALLPALDAARRTAGHRSRTGPSALREAIGARLAALQAPAVAVHAARPRLLADPVAWLRSAGLGTLWRALVAAAIAHFAVTCIDQFARARAAAVDEARVRQEAAAARGRTARAR